MVDGLGVGDVGNIVLRDRQHLAEDGIIIVVLTLEGGSGQVLAGPDIVSRGFVYVRGAETLMEEAKQVLDERMQYLSLIHIYILQSVQNKKSLTLQKLLQNIQDQSICTL